MKKQQKSPFPLRLDDEDEAWIGEISRQECRSRNSMISYIIKQARRQHEKRSQ